MTSTFEELNTFIELGEKKVYDTLKNHFNLIIYEKLCVIINKCLNRNEPFPNYFKKFLDKRKLMKIIHNNQIALVELRELTDQLPFSKSIKLLKKLFQVDYLFKLISIKAIKKLEHPNRDILKKIKKLFVSILTLKFF